MGCLLLRPEAVTLKYKRWPVLPDNHLFLVYSFTPIYFSLHFFTKVTKVLIGKGFNKSQLPKFLK